MKFLPLNVDFSSVTPDPLNSRKPAHAAVKEGCPLKSGYFTVVGWSSIKMVANRLRHAADHNKHWQLAF